MTYKEASQIYSNYLYMKTRYMSIEREIAKIYSSNHSSDVFPSDRVSMPRKDIMFMHDTITEYLHKLELEMDSDVK